ncbi:F-box/kelch-repeat protein At3g23880-like [Rutidosis leptorrhynchoides]|uniref:F-box/kelch-repeat protein At3g23880-like n=1 Tax=Rutidosis leptorrhynchoides TaxID=125765 RepID=UPI003A998CBA
MPDYIPSVIQIKIFYHLPIKSRLRFRSVSKEWKSLIDSSEFKSDHILGQTQRKRFLLKVYKGMNVDDPEYRGKGDSYWVVEDDDIFPQNKISLTYPQSFNLLLNKYGLWYNNVLEFVGSSHGLLCFTGCYVGEVDDCFNRYVIWNLSIRKSITIDALYYEHVNAGFGVCPNSLDLKIVRIIRFYVPYCNVEHKLKNWVWRVEVFTLSARVWRSPLIKLPSKWVGIILKSRTPVVLNGFIYSVAELEPGHRWGECKNLIKVSIPGG